jgi:hypothetical protein
MDPETVMTDDIDASRHMLSTRRHQWDEHGRPVQAPVTFLEQVHASRQSLQSPPDPGKELSRNIELAGTEVLVAASLLREFAARLRHDVARGEAVDDAEQLALLSDDLVERFYAATGLRG